MVPPAFRFVGPVESRTEQDSEAVEPLSAGGSGGLVMRLNSGVPAVAGGDRVSSGPRLTWDEPKSACTETPPPYPLRAWGVREWSDLDPNSAKGGVFSLRK